MTNNLRLVPAIAGLLAWLLTPTSAQSVDQSFYYKLSTQFRGNGMKLDVFNGGPKNNLTRLEPDQDVSGQFWRFVGNGDGTFRLSTLFRGPDMCLDIFNGGANNNQPHLIKCGNFSGQLAPHCWRSVKHCRAVGQPKRRCDLRLRRASRRALAERQPQLHPAETSFKC
jgi:hypothetical protein